MQMTCDGTDAREQCTPRPPQVRPTVPSLLMEFNMKPFLAILAIIGAASGIQTSVGQETGGSADLVVPVWKDAMPAWEGPTQAERDTTGDDGRLVAGKRVIRLGNVSQPELHVYRPSSNDSGTAVVIAPGGGYSILAWDLEGTEIARWFQSIGVTGIVVKYRVPTRSNDQKWLAPVQDIQRAISLARSGAIDGVKPTRVGVLGFSAGGNASARTALAGERHYEATDASDETNCTPDFAVLVYPAWLVREDNANELIDELVVTKKSPPMFLAHAGDDRISAMSSVTLYSKLHESGVPASLHVFASGGHGFGGRMAGTPPDAWKDLCETWMASQDWLAQ